ncbi:LOW QUALITY PROTEIN: hypothetical protein OSB04_013180 [Centaurea solstitialis]|uniref:Reverse transcriptase domain-containing protein n=1 Tax=Centaurea solstitialis TaxID=347529 RepID=A0AA38TNE6_9ASTR|nr:LOW QUALITY PROTEIN: hypothetical protein OSB04_013180 [Centaurea solstitialis]
MNWVKHQDKRPLDETGERSGVFEEDESELFSRQRRNFSNDREGDRSSPEHLPWAAKKVKLPEFSGFDPQGWMTKAELYFDIHGIAPQFRIRLAQLSMVGVAQHWFSIVNEIYMPLLWDQFTKELLQRFSGLEIQNPYKQLATLQQVNSIHEYIEDFEYLLSLVPRLLESQALGYFVAGLQDEVKRWVHLHRPKSRLDAMYLAKDVEQLLRPSSLSLSQSRSRYQSVGGYGLNVRSDLNPSVGHADVKGFTSSGFSDRDPFPRFTPGRFEPGRRSVSSTRLNSTASSEPVTSGIRNRGVRSLSLSLSLAPNRRTVERRDCASVVGKHSVRLISVPRVNYVYYCWLTMNLWMLLDDSEVDVEPLAVAVGSCTALECVGSLVTAKSGGKTLKIEGTISGIPIVILVDSGATHNFVSRKLATALGISSEFFNGINISLGDSHVVFVNKRCLGLPIVISGCEFFLDALLFEMGHLDMILGIEWLKTLGDVLHNWEAQTMRFLFRGKSVYIQGMSESEAPQQHFVIDTRGCKSNSSADTLFPKQQRDLQLLFDKFKAVFRDPTGLPPTRSCDHGIVLVSPSSPICVRPYRYPHVQKAEIEIQVQELLSMGMIRPSKSAFSSPVILVRKKDGSWRMCVDYRALNKATVPNKFPILVVDELIDELSGTKFFTKLDLKPGYNQIRMQPDSVEKTVFRTHDGHYEYLVMPFGLTNAPAIFQATMNDIFWLYLRKFVTFARCAHDSPSFSTKPFCEVLFWANFNRVFGASYYRRRSGYGSSKDNSSFRMAGVTGFSGTYGGYYRKFIRHYGCIAKPLTDLTKKDTFCWNIEAQTAFDALKQAMTTAPVLAIPDFSIPFVIECDASGRGVGAVLMQHKKPMAYFSKALNEQNLAKSAYEREIMALVLTVQHWRSYLLGTKFCVYTDQKSLRFLLEQRITNPGQQNWVAKLLGYQFEIIYKPGRAEDGALGTGDQADGGSEKGCGLTKIISDLSTDSGSHPGYSVKQGVLYYKDRLVIPRTFALIPSLLTEFHSSLKGGHSGYYRTYRRLATNLYWPGMISRVQEFVRACDVTQPLDIPDVIWEHLSMDFIVGLQKSKGYDTLLVVVDRLSKYSHFILMRHPYTAKSVAEVFVREVVRHHGIPKSIELFRLQGTKLNMSSANHPESDGQTEVINRCLETYLRCFAIDQPCLWARWIPWAEFWYNSTFHGSMGRSPFEIVYGHKPPSVVQFFPGKIRVEAVGEELRDRDEALKQLKSHLANAQSIMKEQCDRKRRDITFALGECVYVKLKPYRQLTMAKRISQKLSARFFGPFKILERIGPVAYKLELPLTSRIHPVIHVSLLKKATSTTSQILPPELEIDGRDILLREEVCAERIIDQNGTAVVQWLVRWQG